MGVADSGSLHHTSYVVNDIERAARTLADSLSIQWGLWTIEPERCTVHGSELPFSFRVAIAEVGDSNLELIQPLKGRSVYVEHLEEKGEGFHHTCLIYPSREALRAAKDELAAQGREMTQSGDLGDACEFCYFHIAEVDSALELLFLSQLPPPETAIG